jgi:beta-lactamase class A
MLTTAGFGLAAMPAAIAGSQRSGPSPDYILDQFRKLPGTIALRIWAPAAQGKPEFAVASNAPERLFVGSAIKAIVLGEVLRSLDGPDIVQMLTTTQLALDESVWSVDSATFNPPHLTGQVSLRTTLEAMINHSDNTATDMALQYAGAGKVRGFIASLGLQSTMIPDSTRSLFGYLLGASNYRTFTWAELEAAGKSNAPFVNSPLNDVETLASSADDFIRYYSIGLPGGLFKNPATVSEFRRILTFGDAIWLVPLPLGVQSFAKGGSIDVPGFHCLCVPGGMIVNGRWVYFAFIINWKAAAVTDPATMTAFVKAVSAPTTHVVEKLPTDPTFS